MLISTPLLKSAIEVTHLRKVVSTVNGSLSILHDISLSVAKGDSLAIVGASGSGKTTLLGLMAGLDTPSSGEVLLMGKNISAATEDQRSQIRAEYIGFVFQSFQLVNHLNALENVQLPLELKGVSTYQAAIQAKVWLEKVGLGERITSMPATLSGGEQQRVALARAFVTQPSILFADEPTGSLDDANGQKIIDLLFQLNNDVGSTLVLVTHDLSLAKRCHRQIVVRAGEVMSN